MVRSLRFLAVLFGIVAATACSSQSPTYTPPSSSPYFYVTDIGSIILGYPLTSNGNVTPPFQISGSGTQVLSATGIVRDSTGRIYIANNSQNQIVVFPPNVAGNVSPVYQVSGSATGLSSPFGLGFSSQGYLLVANQLANSVTGYTLPANGNAAPTITISGTNTGLSGPDGVATDSHGNIYVSNYTSNTISVFAPGAVGNITPLRTISGSATGLSGPVGMAFDSSGNLYVVNNFATSGNLGNSITVYSPGASSNAAPINTISGSNTDLSVPEFMAIDKNNRIYVSNFGATGFPGYVLVFASGANGNATPAQIVGPLNGAVGMSL
jgi:6-phosphogluconolactonase (cycloisomerase 2 family)